MTSSHDLAKSDSLSTLSKDSTETSATPSTEAFSPVKALNIHSRGIRLIRLPVPSNELTIPVYDTTGRVCYVSRRNKTCSGDAVLFGIGGGNHDDRRHSEQWEDDGRTFEGAPLIETEYFFGPGRDPVITILDQDEPAASKKSAVESQKSLDEKHQLAPSLRSVTTNSTLVGAPSASNHKSSFKFTSAWSFKTCSFIVPGSNYKFTWEKERAILPSGEKVKLLSLYWHPTAGDSKSSPKVKVAHLVRSASTRTPGTRPSTAGNGGRLELSHLVQCTGDQTMLASNIVYDLEKKTASSQEPVIDEALVVATCLSMMKKEGDRRRALQFMMIGAMASGGA